MHRTTKKIYWWELLCFIRNVNNILICIRAEKIGSIPIIDLVGEVLEMVLNLRPVLPPDRQIFVIIIKKYVMTLDSYSVETLEIIKTEKKWLMVCLIINNLGYILIIGCVQDLTK